MKKLSVKNILKSLVAIPSVSGDLMKCQKIIKFSQSLLNSQKVKSKIITVKNRQILVWGETNLSKSEWLVNSHLDVVPAKPEQFKLLQNGNRIFGRGSADTKTACAIMLSNSSSWVNIAKSKHLTFMLVTDEEIGGESTKEILKKMKNLKGGIFLEPTDEKIITQAKGIIQIKIQAKGVPSHGSRPWKGVSALEILTNALTKFRTKHPTPKKETTNTTFNFSIFESNGAINQIPKEATLWCDVRWNPKEDPKIIIKEFQRFFFKTKIEIVKLESTVNCSTDSDIFRDFSKSMAGKHLEITPGFEHGSSDARHLTAKGIPAIVFGPKGNNQHADNEWVSLKSLDKVTKVLNSWISQLN